MKIRFIGQALSDLEAITDYIGARSPQGARHVLKRMRAVIERLADHPFLGKQTDDPTIR